MEWWFGDPDAADADLTAAASESGPGMPADDPWVRAFAQLHLGRVRLRQQRYDEATELFDHARTNLDQIGDVYLAELELRFRARGASLEGDPARAIELGHRALANAEQLGHTEGIAISLLAIGEAKRDAGDRDGAASMLRQAVEFSVAADHIGSVCQALSLLAAIEADSGNRARAKELIEALLRAQKAAGLPILTPGGVVQDLVADLLDGQYPAPPEARKGNGGTRAGRPAGTGPRLPGLIGGRVAQRTASAVSARSCVIGAHDNADRVPMLPRRGAAGDRLREASRAEALAQQKRAGYAAWGAMWRSAMTQRPSAP